MIAARQPSGQPRRVTRFLHRVMAICARRHRVAQRKRYVPPDLKRRERLAKVAEGGRPRITDRGATVITPP